MEVQVLKHPFVYYLLPSIYLLICVKGGMMIPAQSSTILNRSSFPADFIFGAGSSAYQYEGAAESGGRKPSIWDTFAINQSEKILDHSNGNVADNFYEDYKEDIALMKEVGLDSFRFSLSWSRILPPFGDRVKHWVTVNEPNLFSMTGYATGTDAPGRCSNYIGSCPEGNSGTEPYLVAHHLLLCHATAVKLYKKNYQASQQGAIGITVYTWWTVPKFQTISCKKAASRSFDFLIGWFLHPIAYGTYPECMQVLAGDRLPKFTNSESELVRGSIDFVGVNYYTSYYGEDLTSYNSSELSYTTDSRVNLTHEKNGIPLGEPTSSSWLYIYPEGIRRVLLHIKKKYNPPYIYITENGLADANSSSWTVNKATNDILRIKYHRLHLSSLLKAIEDGVDVRGYYVWSFLDNFEWDSGYTYRFGITYVDFKNGLKRYLKNSGLWFKNFLQKEANVSTAAASLLYSDQ
ncbi:beta-glucosidase 17-like isoform X3 [Pistacia vera]|uniref:beta-glucosidase 17-like isoform X3 n=1 Tax=Pistacia vera TaxID=55513 RepID=UPI0012636EE2|nr:beta-glucosidase 17-like isoform X3 [Pistacia vera]XP_031274805.1 beta-glucosidase 17-like isoform X3 [Pistacia vera]